MLMIIVGRRQLKKEEINMLKEKEEEYYSKVAKWVCLPVLSAITSGAQTITTFDMGGGAIKIRTQTRVGGVCCTGWETTR